QEGGSRASSKSLRARAPLGAGRASSLGHLVGEVSDLLRREPVELREDLPGPVDLRPSPRLRLEDANHLRHDVAVPAVVRLGRALEERERAYQVDEREVGIARVADRGQLRPALEPGL